MTDPIKLCQKTLLARGWTLSLIRGLLGEPDTLAQNTHHPKARPIKRYDLARVEAAEQSQAWLDRRKAQQSRTTGRRLKGEYVFKF